MVTKIINEPWLVEETTLLDKLVIQEGGMLTAPEGKFVNLSVNGIGKQPKPGTYIGNVVLTVADTYHMPPHGLMLAMNRSEEFRTAVVIEDNKIVEEKSVPAVVRRGTVTGTCADHVRIASSEESFNGFLITGNSEYEINDAVIEFDGFSANDFMGVGSGVTAIDNARVTLNNSTIKFSGVTRCAVHVGGDSVLVANNCKFSNHSPDDQEWIGDFSWGVGFVGCHRLVQLCDNGTAYYNNCDFDSNGWALASIDGCDDAVAYYFKDCRMNLSGPNSQGYGSFCIGDRNVVSFDHCDVHVNGYTLILRGMIGRARAVIKNGCNITGELYGIICIGDNQTPCEISDSTIETDKACIVAKGSATTFNIRNSVLKAGNDVILQIMDNDEAGMFTKTVVLPVGRVDEYMEGRDLAAIDPANDIIMNLSEMDVKGNFFNSTTNLHMEKEAIPGRSGKVTFGGMFDPPEGSEGTSFLDAMPDDAPEQPPEDYDAALRGPKNLALNLVDTRFEGVASSAVAAYREGLTQIEEDERTELTNITQTAAPTVNNGVVVNLDKNSSWIVTGTSYITGLTLVEGSIVKGLTGKKVRMTVDGTETELAPGTYTGKIVLELV